MAHELWREGRPLVVMIDELDRCRPSYAVELLEVAKHLFSVDQIVFVLAVNRSELAHSVKALYGDGFDAEGYLGRFFDVDFRLPEPDRESFINSLITSTNIEGYFDNLDQRVEREPAQSLLQSFLGRSNLSLRQVAQAMHHLGLVLASLRSNERSFAITMVVALILRTLIPDWYYRFRRGETSDHDLVETVFGHPGLRNLRSTNARVPFSTGALFEAAIIVSATEIPNSARGRHVRHWSPDSSKLWDRYHKLVSEAGEDEAVTSEERNYAEEVIRDIDVLRSNGIGFLLSAERIELLSPALLR